jgi:hypothetical protein
MSQHPDDVVNIMMGPILELQTGIKELQLGLEVYLNEVIKSFENENKNKELVSQGKNILFMLKNAHLPVEKNTTAIYKWIEKCEQEFF